MLSLLHAACLKLFFFSPGRSAECARMFVIVQASGSSGATVNFFSSQEGRGTCLGWSSDGLIYVPLSFIRLRGSVFSAASYWRIHSGICSSISRQARADISIRWSDFSRVELAGLTAGQRTVGSLLVEAGRGTDLPFKQWMVRAVGAQRLIPSHRQNLMRPVPRHSARLWQG